MSDSEQAMDYGSPR
ncbi:hypothetical protein [Bacillus tequilensis]